MKRRVSLFRWRNISLLKGRGDRSEGRTKDVKSWPGAMGLTAR